MSGSRIMGVAAYERGDREIRVYEFGLDSSAAAGADEIACGLLDALELACMAGGARRLLMLPRATAATALLTRRGFRAIAEGCAGTWYEKSFA